MRRSAAIWLLFILLANALMVSGNGGADGVSSGAHGRDASRAVTLIYDVCDLQNMSLDLNGSYELANDIDASDTVNWNDGAGFMPVGNSLNRFYGTLDGKNHTISGLFIDRPTDDFVGLFGDAAKANSVKNTGFININVTGGEYVGGLAGYIDYYYTVSNSYATGNVNGTLYVGGLVGGISGGATVNNSYATGNVTGTDHDVGGLAGYNFGTVSNSYASGNVKGTLDVGGLVGSDCDSIIKNSYFKGSVNGTVNVGGITGRNYFGRDLISNSHYNIDDVSINGGHYITKGGLFDAQYRDWFSNGLALDISNYSNALVPSGECYYISNVQGLRALLGFADVPTCTFVLASDLDLSNDSGLYIPYLSAVFDGDNHNISNMNLGLPFVSCLGMFGINNAGTIMNIGISDFRIEGYEYVGGLVGINSGVVDNSSATGNVNGTSYCVGGLVGDNNKGTVNNSYATGDAEGWSEIGGLVGYNDGTISNSYATGTVIGKGDDVGGLAGYNVGTISNSYASGNVNGSSAVGGLVGDCISGRLDNSYATGNVSGTDDIGGLIGSFGIIWAYWDHSWLSNSYATGNVDGSSNVGGLVGVNYHCMLSNLYATGNVTGDHNVGGLAGYSHGSVMTSFATGNVEGNYCVGGLVGNNSGTMNNSYANGNVTGDHDVGGLMGTLFDGGVEKSYATGNVTGINYTGGLVGSIIYSGVSTSYATGNVNGTNEIGGLIGYWDLGWLSNSFATGNVNGSNRVGGLVGGNYQGTLSNSYAMGYVTGTDCVGGLVGYNIGMVSDSYATGYVTGTDDQVGGLVGNNGDVVWNCFWDNETSGQSSSFGGTGKTTAEMKTCSTFTDAGWDFRNVWFMVENVTYPVFQWQDIIFPIADAGIDQTVDEGTVVTFDGRGSFDSFGIANYTWRFRDGVRRTVYGVGPTYKFDNPGIFNVELRVTNIFGFWSVDNTTITVIYITPPIADAGPDQIVDEGSLVAFNGSGSTAGAGIVNYTWTFNDGTGGIELYGAAPSHTFNVPGVCAVTLKVTDARGKWDIDTMNVTVKDIRPPVAEAGPDQTVDEGMLVSFNGSGSTGIAGIVNYTWTFYDGIDNIKLYGATPSHIFYARGVYIVTLNVTDAIGHWDMDKMTVTVKEDVTPPVADAGPDRLVDEGTLVTFDGSGSKDNVGIVSYSWKFIDGAPVTLYGVRPEYRFDNPGIFVVRLILTDVAGNRGTDTMTVTVKDTTAPVAEAGPDRTVDGGTEVRFDGRASSDNIGIVDYTWTFVYGPGQIVLHGVLAQFTFVIPGVYSVRLIVSDAAGLRAEDSLLLTVKDVTPPVADAGPDQVVGEKTSVTFEGNGSSDNAGIVNYTWTFEYGAKRIVLYGVSPSFIFIVPGVYYVKLKVSDAAGFWADDAMTLTVKDITPLVANAGRDQTVLVGNTVVLDGSPSTDNGVTERYFWNFTYNGKAQSLEGRTVQFKFDKPGVYVVVLTVVDGAGNRGEDRVVITVEPTVNVLQGLLWMPVLLIAVAGIAGYVVTRKRRAMKGGPSEPPEEPGGTVTAMTAAAGSTPADEVETLQMDDGPQAGAGDPRLEDEATAIASVAEAAALPIAVTPIPMRHVRCLNCRMRIPLYTDGSGVIYCPNCGKTRIYRPKV